jgi:hypothetical protein
VKRGDLNSLELNLGKQITCVFALIITFAIWFFPLPSLVLSLASDLSCLLKVSMLIEQLVARKTTLPLSDFIYTRSNSNFRRNLCSKFIIFIFRLFIVLDDFSHVCTDVMIRTKYILELICWWVHVRKSFPIEGAIKATIISLSFAL